MRYKLFILPLALLLFSCTKPLVIKNLQIDSPGIFMFGTEAKRNFYVDVAIKDSVEFYWTAETNGSQAATSLLFFNNFMFVTDLSGRLYSFDKNNGKLIGYEKYSGSISTAPVLYKYRLSFVVNELKEKYATYILYDFVSGKILAEERIAGSVNNEMILLEDGVIVVSDGGEIIKFNFAGERAWSLKTGVTTLSSPAAYGRHLYVGNQKGELVCINSDTGMQEFVKKISAPIEGGLTIDSGILYFGDSDGVLYAFDTKEMSVKWHFDTKAKIVTTPVLNAGSLFIGNLAGSVYSLNRATGSKNWHISTKGVINATPLLTKTLLIQPDYNKKVYFINPLTGMILRTIEFDRRAKTTPAFFDGLLYLGSDRGEIHSYKTFSAE